MDTSTIYTSWVDVFMPHGKVVTVDQPVKPGKKKNELELKKKYEEIYKKYGV